MRTFGRRRREERDRAQLEFLARRRFLNEDVTVFGEQLAELHVDTLTDELSEDARDFYRHALESYERAKATLKDATDLAGLEPAAAVLVEGRHRRACVLALVAGEPLPVRLGECFFNPQHGPSHTEVAWTPPGGVERMVLTCASDAQRLARGEAPQMRLVRVGDRFVPMVLAEDETSWFHSDVDHRSVRDGRRDAKGDAALWGMTNQPQDLANPFL